ncbi:MAG TPA: thioesterase family protein [Thermodesulfobacteriota bacterium]|nr:thioesterase family protein [Thermodesulfobacteriota bacterium]
MKTKTEQYRSTSVALQVPYYDVDVMEIVWNGNYFKYFERARQTFFLECGLDLRNYALEKNIIFPVIRSKIKHVRPLRMNDDFICTAFLKEARIKIILGFEIRLATSGLICAKGESEQVALQLPEMEMAFKIPEDIQDALYGRS